MQKQHSQLDRPLEIGRQWSDEHHPGSHLCVLTSFSNKYFCLITYIFSPLHPGFPSPQVIVPVVSK